MAANRWICRGSHFNQIHVGFCGHAQGFLNADDTKRLVFYAIEADVQSSDFTIEPMLALVIARPAVKEVSDVEFLLATGSRHLHQLTLISHPGKPNEARPSQKRLGEKHAPASGLAGDVLSDLLGEVIE